MGHNVVFRVTRATKVFWRDWFVTDVVAKNRRVKTSLHRVLCVSGGGFACAEPDFLFQGGVLRRTFVRMRRVLRVCHRTRINSLVY